jgi:hypothetical protein
MAFRYEAVIEQLRRGERVVHREGGNSMTPIIRSREPVLLAWCEPADLKKGDIVFCKVRGNFYTHKILGVKTAKGERLFQIGNNHGHVNGCVGADKIFGRVLDVGYHLLTASG